MAFTAEGIENARDPNRRGRLRVDFCVHLVDKSYWRFHPGTTGHSSSTPFHIAATLPDAARGAAEHAAIQWNTFGQGTAWTFIQAKLVPQTDRMGKNAVWEKIAALLNRNAQDCSVTDSNTWNITDGRIFPWWLWVSNLRNRTSQVIGEGIKEVYLTQTQEHEVLFNFNPRG